MTEEDAARALKQGFLKAAVYAKNNEAQLRNDEEVSDERIDLFLTIYSRHIAS